MEEVCSAEADEMAAAGFTTAACGLELLIFGVDGLEEEDPNEENLGVNVATEELAVEVTAAAFTMGDVMVLSGGGVVEQDTRSGTITQQYPANGSKNLFITNLLRLH
jgi:hypothetical protein